MSSDADSASLYNPSEEEREDVDWKSTPSSRILKQQGVSEQAKTNVRAVDPNEGRCLVENCVEIRAVDFAHCFPRSMSSNRLLMDSIEWYWNMRHNTLNLDTRHNIFRAGAAVHRLFDNHSWFLIPDETIIQTYHDALTHDKETLIADCALFPNIPDRDKPEYFEYKLIPTSRMNEIALHRQADPSGRRPTSNDFATCFVILETGRKLKNVPYATQTFLVKSYPALAHVIDIYDAQILQVQQEFNQGDHMGDGRTAPRRLRDRKRPRTQNDPDDSPTPAPGQAGQSHHALKRQPSISLSKRSLKLHDEEFEGKKWTKDAVRDWSKRCRPLPEVAHSPWKPNEICV